jgi:chorismate synthase
MNKGILMMESIRHAQEQSDSLGGTIMCMITGLMSGLGEPVFDKMEA